MKIILGADHGGYKLKNHITKWLTQHDYDVNDIGVFSSESMDYPDIAFEVAKKVADGSYDKGVVVCGSGVGVSITANKVKGIRAVLCHDTVTARLSREHNDTNIIAMGGRFVAKELAFEILNVWLNTDFSEGRHQQRINKISNIEKEQI